MAPKKTEPTLSDVLKVITELALKVTAIEALLVNHSAISVTQADAIITTIKEAIAGKSLVLTPQANDAGNPRETATSHSAQNVRPLRQARMRQANDADEAANRKKPKAADKTKIGGRVCRTETANTPASDTSLPPPAAATAKPRATKPTGSSSIKTLDTDSEGQWQVVASSRGRRSHNKKQTKAVTVGSGTEDVGFQVAEITKYIQAWQFKAVTTVDQIKNHLNKIVAADYFVEKRQLKTDRHASFIIGMPESIYSRIATPTVWPQGIRYVDWFFQSRALPQVVRK